MDALNIGPLLIGSERLLVGIGLVVMLRAAATCWPWKRDTRPRSPRS